MLLRTRMIAWKELVQIGRDTRTLIVIAVLPLVMLLLYGYGINLDVSHLRLAVYDQDRTRASRDLIAAFSRTDHFDLTDSFQSYGEVTDLLDRGRAKVALVIPRGYADDLAAGMTVPVQLLIDGSDSTTASTAIGYAGAMVRQHSARIRLSALDRAGIAAGGSPIPIDHRVRYWYNPELRSTNFIIPGLVAVILMMFGALLTSMTVVRERERGTIEQLMVSPVLPRELMIGKIVPYILIAFVDVVMVVAAGRLVFRVPLLGSPALVLALSLLFLMAALGIGMLISTIATTQQFAMTVAVMATQLPSVLMSGFLFPISSMPPPIQAFTNLIPASHFVKILRAIFLKGSGLSLLWQPALILLGFGVVMLAASAMRFKKKL